MGSIKDIVEAVETRMVALGFTQIDEVFDFDAVPESKINKAFRIETRLRTGRYHSGNLSNPIESLEIWIAYKAKRDRRAVTKTGLDDRETIESDLINAAGITDLDSDPLLMMDQEASNQKLLPNHLIVKLAFSVDYLRDVSPS
jgi:hypothetical protein